MAARLPLLSLLALASLVLYTSAEVSSTEGGMKEELMKMQTEMKELRMERLGELIQCLTQGHLNILWDLQFPRWILPAQFWTSPRANGYGQIPCLWESICFSINVEFVDHIPFPIY